MSSTRTIQNTSGSTILIDDIGVAISTTLYVIPPERYWYFASSSDIDTFIDSGDFIVSHNGTALSPFDAKCLIHEATDYMSTEVDTPLVSGVNYQTKNLRFQGPIFVVSRPQEGDTYVGLRLSGSAEGKEAGYQFFNNGANIKDKWLDHEGSNIPCDGVPGVVATTSKMRQITYTNDRKNSRIFIDIYKNGMLPGNLLFSWDISGCQYAWKTNGLDSVTFMAGDSIRVFARDNGGVSPSKAVVKITLVNLDNVLGEGCVPDAP